MREVVVVAVLTGSFTGWVLWALQYRELLRKRDEAKTAGEYKQLWQQATERADFLENQIQELSHEVVNATDDDDLAGLFDRGMREDSNGDRQGPVPGADTFGE